MSSSRPGRRSITCRCWPTCTRATGFSRWSLVQLGRGSVNRAIRRNRNAGKPTDYLSLRMPRETRHYVPS
ncbi:MAG: hypothetical protein R3E68_12560 [Burkholderiaceae bacterium]